jgi:DGQHR domain-containing protein
MDVTTYNFGTYTSEKETAHLLHNFGLDCVFLNWKMKGSTNKDEGEIDGIFYDQANQIYIIYDDSTLEEGRQDKVSKFLNKWKDIGNQNILRKELNLKEYPIYVLYIDKSGKTTRLDSLDYVVGEFIKIIYTEDYKYFESIFKTVGKWAKNDFYNFLGVKPRIKIKQEITANQIYIGKIAAFVFADRVENILNYSFISRRRKNTNGYQRLVEKKRVDQMALQIKSNKLNSFPNSILLNCVDNINVTLKTPQECPCEIKFDLPNNFSSCKVVDGQHRLLAFSKLDSTIQDSHSLAVVMFLNMPTETEIQTFIDINKSQKRIDPNLIYSLKSDLIFQIGTKESREKIAVEISKKLNSDTSVFKGNVFLGNAGEEKKSKITLTTMVQAMLEYKIVDSNKGFLQDNELDIENPYLKIKGFTIELLKKDSINAQFYKSNNGIQLILKFCSILYRNIELKNIKVDLETAITEFVKSINKNKASLSKKYGKAGFSELSNIIFNDIKAESLLFKTFEIEIKKLK